MRRATLSVKSLDDKYADDDSTWRRRVLAVHNAAAGDFPTLREYNDYLENVEDVIYCIVNKGEEMGEHVKKIKEMEQSDAALITIRQSQRAEEDRAVVDLLAAERTETDRRRLERMGEEEDVKKVKKRMKQERLELKLGDRDQMSREMAEAKEAGIAESVRAAQAAKGAATAGGDTLTVFDPPSGLRSKAAVAAMGKDGIAARIKSAGGVAKGSMEEHDECWTEALASLFV